MLTLDMQLALEREKSRLRRSRARALKQRKPTKRQKLERVAAALFARDFLNDLDAMLIARSSGCGASGRGIKVRSTSKHQTGLKYWWR